MYSDRSSLAGLERLPRQVGYWLKEVAEEIGWIISNAQWLGQHAANRSCYLITADLTGLVEIDKGKEATQISMKTFLPYKNKKSNLDDSTSG